MHRKSVDSLNFTSAPRFRNGNFLNWLNFNKHITKCQCKIVILLCQKLNIPKETGFKVQMTEYARSKGVSVNAFIIEAVKKAMEEGQ